MFDFYSADARDLAPSEILTQVESVGKKLGAEEDPFVPVDLGTVIALGGSNQRWSPTESGNPFGLPVGADVERLQPSPRYSWISTRRLSKAGLRRF